MIRKFSFISFVIFSFVFIQCHICKAETDLEQAQTNIFNLMDKGYFDNANIETDKYISDFSDDPNLPESVYWIIRRYEWTNKFDEAQNLYQKMLQDYPDSNCGKKAKIGISRCEILKSIIAKNSTSAKDSINIMLKDCAGQEDLPETLGMFAERFEWQWQFEDEKWVYRLILQNYPKSSFADKAQIGIARANLLSYIAAKDFVRFESGLDKLFADYANNPGLAQTALLIGEWFYKDNTATDPNDYLNRAVKVWERVIKELPNSELIPETYYWIAGSYLKLGENLKAAEAFGNVYQGNPKYIYADYCLFAQADCYEKAKAAKADTGITTDQIKEIYRKVVTNFPKSNYAFTAALRLDDLKNEPNSL